MERILELIGEGGVITFARIDDDYFFTTEEMFGEEVDFDDLKSHSHSYPTFYAGMLELLRKYPVFNLHPEYINPSYMETIKIYFDNYCLYNQEEENWELSTWVRKLK